MAINNINNETITKIRENSVITLPNKPKISAEELKERFVKPIVSSTNSLVAEINRIVEDTNTEITNKNDAITEAMGTLESEITTAYQNYVSSHDSSQTAHADIRGLITDLDNAKVDKVSGKSLISNTEISRLANVDNYNDADIRGLITALNTAKVNKESGKSLISDAEITRLAGVDNYDDTEVKTLITTIQNIITTINGEDDADSTINKLHEIVALLNGYAEGTTLADLLGGKVDKVDGKALSTNDYTTAEKEKLLEIEPSANNYDDTEVRGLITDLDADKADVEHTHSNYTTEDAVQTKINTHDENETAHTDIRTEIEEVRGIAEGKVSAMSFETKAQLDAWLLIPENVETLIVGTNFYIEDLASPDYWWNGTTIIELSTDKIDLTDYAKSDDLATVATTGSYNDLTNTPTIPTIPNISITSGTAEIGKYISQVAVDETDKHKLVITKADLPQGFSGNYEDLIGAPTIPSKTSDLENDSNFATETYVDNKVSSVYKVKGTVANYSSLPSANNVIGDVWNLTDTGANYVWDGSAWDKLGDTVDLSAYAKTTDLFSKNYNDLTNKPTIPTLAYNNTTSGLTATTYQGAIDELANLVDGIETLLGGI